MTRPLAGIPFREVWGFVTVGVLGLIADVGAFNVAVLAGVEPLAASLAGFVLGVIVSFVGNRLLTFRHRAIGHLGRAWLTFTIINVIAVGLIQVVVWAGVALDLTLVQLNVARLAAIGAATVGRFFAYRRWVFVAAAGADPIASASGPVPGDASG